MNNVMSFPKTLNLGQAIVCIFICLIALKHEAQTPKSIVQKPFDSGIQNLYISPDNKHFMTYEGDIQTLGGATFKLWDYNSKIMIAETWLSSENGPGSGKTTLLNSGVITVSTNQNLLKIDLFKQTTDTIFKTKWPEYIHAHTIVNDTILLVSTKIYSENKDGVIDDITNNSNLYSYNLKTKHIEYKKSFQFEIPYITYSKNHNLFLLANNKGECLLLNKKLEEQHKPIQILDKNRVARFLYLTDENYLIANPALVFEKKSYRLDIGDGILKVKNLDDEEFDKTIAFKEQEFPKQEDTYIVNYSPSNLIYNIQVNESLQEVLLNYGHNKIADLHLKSMLVEDVSPKDFKLSIGKIILNPFSNELIVNYGKPNMFNNYKSLALYNYNSQRLTYKFNEINAPQSKLKILYKIGGNYVFGASENSKSSSLNSIRFQNPSSNQSVLINCISCKMTINPLNDYWILRRFMRSEIVIGKPQSRILKLSQVDLDTEIDSNGKLPYFSDSKVFDLPELDKKTALNTVYYYFPKSNSFLVSLEKNKKIFFALINQKGEIIEKFNSEYDVNWSVSFDGQYIAISDDSSKNNEKTIRVFSTQSFNELFAYNYKGNYTSAVNFSTNSKYVYFQQTSISDSEEINELKEIEIEKGLVSLKTIHNDEYYSDFTVNKEENILYINTSDYIKKIDLSSRKVLVKQRSSYKASPVYYYSDINKIVMDAGDYLLFFNTKSNKTLNYYHFENQKNIVVNSDGYYMASAGFNMDQFGFLINQNGYPFSQFDFVYNRPDIILTQLGLSTKEILSLYEKAYLKRLKNSGVTVDIKALNNNELPITTLISNNSAFTTSNKSYKIKAQFTDKLHNLKSWNIWVNGVPVFGQKGKAIDANTYKFDVDYDIQLSDGNNNIQISCRNAVGLESLRQTKTIFYDGKPSIAKLYFIGIGVSKYKDSTYNLSYAKKDALDLEKLFKNDNDAVETYLYIDENATKENILKLKEILKKTTVDDQIILSFSGHGLLSDNLDFYCATYDVDFKHPEAKGLLYSDIEWLLDGIPSRENLVFIDACHSGALDKDEEETQVVLQPNEDSSITLSETVSNYNTKGAIGQSIAPIGLNNSYTLMQELFSDLSRGNGAVIISASGGKEYALENNDWKNGAFTFAVRSGIEKMQADLNNDKKITVLELKTYVSNEVEKLTNGLQRPTSRQENLENDFEIIRGL